MSIRRVFLYLLIASVSISALLGIGVILFGDFGDLEAKVLLTSLTITVTSILGLACGAAMEAGRGRVVPITGIVTSVIAAVMWLIIVWNWQDQADIFAKILVTITLAAVSLAHVSLLSLARLDGRFIWSRYAVNAAVATLSGYLTYLIWTSFENEPDVSGRFIGVMSIIIAAITVATPIFHKLSGDETDVEKIDAEIERLRKRIVDLESAKSQLTKNEPHQPTT